MFLCALSLSLMGFSFHWAKVTGRRDVTHVWLCNLFGARLASVVRRSKRSSAEARSFYVCVVVVVVFSQGMRTPLHNIRVRALVRSRIHRSESFASILSNAATAPWSAYFEMDQTQHSVLTFIANLNLNQKYAENYMWTRTC